MALESEQGGAGQGGGVADALFGGAGGDAGGGGGEGDAGNAAPGAAPEIQGGADPDWFAQISVDAGEGENASNLDWLKSTGVKDINGLVKVARDNQVALRDSGRVKVPGEGAKPEEVAAFRKAIGVPEDVSGYALPEVKGADGEPVALDDSLIAKLLPKALEHGVPAAAMNGLIADFVAMQVEDFAQFEHDVAEAGAAWSKAQGALSAEKRAAMGTAFQKLGIDAKEQLALRNAMAATHPEGPAKGAAKFLDMMATLGEGLAEDRLLGGGRSESFASDADAQGKIDGMIAKSGTDPVYAQAIRTPGTPENSQWQRLQAAAARHAAKQAQL